ncbi:TPA: hypothetical protein TUW56_000893 [Streptococcus equi subsp. zooepidemicus]|nr:hypothetical protein [Streptococcus equi subsp. zooepidemicus]
MTNNANELAKGYLDAFKTRMRIFTTDQEELDNLLFMLTSSIKSIVTLTGADQASSEVKELAFERARYVYYDALDEFQKNYADEIETLYLINKYKESGALSHD